MRGSPQAAVALLLALSLSGCMGGRGDPAQQDPGFPSGWDEEAPEKSLLASAPYYTLDASSSFILKGHSYGRYVVRVPELLPDVHVFFSTSTRQTTGPQASIDDPDAYHFEFMQVRPLGREIVAASADAVAQFRNAQNPDVYTLTYLYGKGANHQFLAPYDGRPDHWRFEPGYYEFVVATDELLTVGINVHTGSSYWSTYYHPQELGAARAEALGVKAQVFEAVGGQMPPIDEELHGIVHAAPGETANYFTFADVWYDTRVLALGATGTATVTVDDEAVLWKLDLTTPAPAQDEAYAFAMAFNTPGESQTHLQARAVFQEIASAQSTLVVILFVFGVALIPLETAPGLPTTASL